MYRFLIQSDLKKMRVVAVYIIEAVLFMIILLPITGFKKLKLN